MSRVLNFASHHHCSNTAAFDYFATVAMACNSKQIILINLAQKPKRLKSKTKQVTYITVGFNICDIIIYALYAGSFGMLLVAYCFHFFSFIYLVYRFCLNIRYKYHHRNRKIRRSNIDILFRGIASSC